jgi:hypothetical protein
LGMAMRGQKHGAERGQYHDVAGLSQLIQATP